jgi:glucokinase
MWGNTDQASPDGVVVAGIDIGGTKIDVALAGPDRTILARHRLDTLVADGPAAAVRRIAEATAELRTRHAAGAELAAVGVVCPGVVQGDRILLAPNLPGWEDADLAGALRDALGVPRMGITNDVRAGALAEARTGALRGSRCGLYVNLGTGLAAALVVNGQVVEGAHQAAGEIGYSQPLGALGAWPAAAHAHLETAVSGAGLANRAANVLGEPVDAADLFRRTDPVSRHVVHQALAALGTALVNLAVFVDPDRVVVGGGLTGSAGVVLPVLDAHLRAGVPFPPEVVLGVFTSGASLHGAVHLAVDLMTKNVAEAQR